MRANQTFGIRHGARRPGCDDTIVVTKGVGMTSAYVVSDLARQRREVVDAARREPVRIRDADGLMLVLKTEEVDLVNSKILDYYELHARAEIECRRVSPNSGVLSEVAFIADWTASDRETFLDGFAEVLDESRRLGALEPVTFYLRWHSPLAAPVPTPIDRTFTKRLGTALQKHLDR
jgi:hypothetical protein